MIYLGEVDHDLTDNLTIDDQLIPCLDFLKFKHMGDKRLNAIRSEPAHEGLRLTLGFLGPMLTQTTHCVAYDDGIFYQ